MFGSKSFDNVNYDDYDDMNCFCEMVDQQKEFMPYFQLGPLPLLLSLTWAESEFRLC